MSIMEGNVTVRSMFLALVLMGSVWTFEQWVVENNIKALREEVRACFIDEDY
jgi:hypothetical protein